MEKVGVSFPAGGMAQIVLRARNRAPRGTSGRLMYYRLYPGSSDVSCSMDYRFMNLPAGQAVQDTLCFSNLNPGDTYQLRVGGWSTTMFGMEFSVPSDASSIPSMPEGKHGLPDAGNRWFDLSGREVRRTSDGILVRKGRKVIFGTGAQR